MDLCIKEITDRESTPGLYREPGSELIISAIKSKFDSKEAAKISLFADPSPGAKVTVQDVASLLKVIKIYRSRTLIWFCAGLPPGTARAALHV